MRSSILLWVREDTCEAFEQRSDHSEDSERLILTKGDKGRAHLLVKKIASSQVRDALEDERGQKCQ